MFSKYTAVRDVCSNRSVPVLSVAVTESQAYSYSATMKLVLCFIAFLPLVTVSGAELLQVDQYQCPTWFTPRVSNGSVVCECHPLCYINCDPHSESTQLHIEYCMTYNESENRITAGRCPYNFHMQNRSGDFVNLPRLQSNCVFVETFAKLFCQP